MKLLFCTSCHDIRGLNGTWHKCECGKSSGRYNKDGLTAVIRGKQAMVFGISNEFLGTPGGPPSGVWWGEYFGDKQIRRIK